VLRLGGGEAELDQATDGLDPCVEGAAWRALSGIDRAEERFPMVAWTWRTAIDPSRPVGVFFWSAKRHGSNMTSSIRAVLDSPALRVVGFVQLEMDLDDDPADADWLRRRWWR